MMIPEINDGEIIIALSITISELANLIEDEVLRSNIQNLGNQLVCCSVEQPLPTDFYSTMHNLMALLSEKPID